jgi:mono/diheme cytochrome c family protein
MTKVTRRSPAALGLLALGAIALGSALAYGLTLQPAIAPISATEALPLSRAQVARGAALAEIGDCIVCHSAEGGKPFAGGRALPTPFGTLYSDNLTPDAETGIGTWSQAAFTRAMTQGIDRAGNHLYPALPYEHFVHVTDQDAGDIYAYLRSVTPVTATAPPNELIFPLGFRPFLAGWKLLFLPAAEQPFDPAQSDDWNRGAYLVKGLGHCGGCHSPRNLLGAEEHDKALSGGTAEGWIAPPLDASNPHAASWSIEALQSYLGTGFAQGHGAAAGPMAAVSAGLASASPNDLRAIATYINTAMAEGPAVTSLDDPAKGEAASSQGAILFAGACAGCHAQNAPMTGQHATSLAQMTALSLPRADNVVLALIGGIAPPVGGRGPKMPAFAASLSDADIAALATYLRARYTDLPPWADLPATIATARQTEVQP